jgi:hypothetical protein
MAGLSIYQKIQWVVQQNLTGKEDFEGLQNACDRLGIYFIGVTIIPFSSGLPHFDRQRHSILYGSTTFNVLAYQDNSLREGIFFNDVTFSIENYFEKWGIHMLNYGSRVCTFRELINSTTEDDKLLFIRPNDDSKSFAGDVIQFGEIKNWYEKLSVVANTNFSLDSKIVVSEPYNIQTEWRLWIVERKVIAASKYRENFRLKKEEGCPAEVITFAEQRCLEYTPHDVFVMDVCLSGDNYYIVECGCMNGAGFYKANIEKIVRSVSDYCINRFPPLLF